MLRHITTEIKGAIFMLRRIKSDISLTDFYSNIAQCTKDVYYISANGDRLNLKNVLTQIFVQTMLSSSNERTDGYIYCLDENDYVLLDNFLE